MAKTKKRSQLPSNVRNQLAKDVRQAKAPRESLWAGPESFEDNGGITYTMLSRFLSCRERFRLWVVEGLVPVDEFNGPLEYGNMWHACEEALAKEDGDWQQALKDYAAGLVRKYRVNGNEIEKWYRCCKVQFPIYVAYWYKHRDVKNRKPVFQEQPFSVPYQLPSGRTVNLRGKFDSVDVIDKKLYVQENKSKSDPNAENLRQNLPMDLQSMMYLIALKEIEEEHWSNTGLPPKVEEHLKKIAVRTPIGGVRYNVIRRPLSGSRYNIKQKKGLGKAKKGKETKEQFFERLKGVIEENADDFFLRLRMEVSQKDIEDFQLRCLNPIIEMVCDWWNWVKIDPFNPFSPKNNVQYYNHIHFVYPHGVYNPTLENRNASVDRYLRSGDISGLSRSESLFTELK